MHVAGSGRVIIRISSEADVGQILCDRKGTRVAKVVELIGPVGSPFASATPLTNNMKRHVGGSVFAMGEPPGNPKKKLGRRKR